MQNKFHYVLSQFKKVYPLGELVPEIDYSHDGTSRIRIIPGNLECFTQKKSYNTDPSVIRWINWLGESIPLFFDQPGDELFSKQGDQWIIHADIIASSFFLLSNWNEYHNPKRDSYGRFPFSESIQHTFGILHLPVVNYYFDILRHVIEQAYSFRLQPFRWDDRDFAVHLSHDIDTCESAWLQGSYHAIKKRDFFTPLHLFAKKLTGRDAWFNFQDILDLEQEYNAKSTFFFLPRRKPNLGIKNADYSILQPKFRQVFESICQQGSEVALHGSTGASMDVNRLLEDKDRIGVPVTGNRFHFLLYDPVITPAIIEKSGLLYDASLGFTEQSGFRNSFCFPFQPYDIANDKPFAFYELPLMLMDGTLQKYLGLSPEEGLDKPEPIIREVKKFGGCFSFLWHNTHFSPYKYGGWKTVYETTLTRLIDANALLTSGSTIIHTYMKKSFNYD